MTLKEIGEFCECHFLEQKDKQKEQILILFAHATQIVTGFAKTQSKDNKYISMQDMFPDVFKAKELTLEEKQQQEINTWLAFLGAENIRKE